MANDEILLLLHEEGIELVDLGVEQIHELRLRPAAVQRRSAQRGRRRRDQFHELLQLLIRQILIPPLRQALLRLLLQSLPELHRRSRSIDRNLNLQCRILNLIACV